MVKKTEYELERERRIAENRKHLESLGLADMSGLLPTRPKPPPKPKAAPKKKQASNKRKNDDADEQDAGGSDEENARPKKAARRDDEEEGKENGPLRRSSRVAGKKVDYRAVEDGGGQDRSTRAYRISKAANVEMDTEPRDSNKRMHNP